MMAPISGEINLALTRPGTDIMELMESSGRRYVVGLRLMIGSWQLAIGSCLRPSLLQGWLTSKQRRMCGQGRCGGHGAI